MAAPMDAPAEAHANAERPERLLELLETRRSASAQAAMRTMEELMESIMDWKSFPPLGVVVDPSRAVFRFGLVAAHLKLTTTTTTTTTTGQQHGDGDGDGDGDGGEEEDEEVDHSCYGVAESELELMQEQYLRPTCEVDACVAQPNAHRVGGMPFGAMGHYPDRKVGLRGIAGALRASPGLYLPHYRVLEAGKFAPTMDGFEAVLRVGFYDELRLAPEEWPVLVVCEPDLVLHERQEIVRNMFETWGCPIVAIVSRPEAIAVDMGFSPSRGGAVVVDLQLDSTVVTVLGADGSTVASSRSQQAMGVESVATMLDEKYFADAFTSVPLIEQDAIRIAVVKQCCHAHDPSPGISDEVCAMSERESSKGQPLRFSFPSTHLKRAVDEVYFPASEDSASLPRLVSRILESACHDGDQKAAWSPEAGVEELLSNLVLVGEGATISGLDTRLENELRGLHPDAVVSVTVPEEPELASYRAAVGILARSDLWRNESYGGFISKEHYDAENWSSNFANVLQDFPRRQQTITKSARKS